MLLWDSHSFQVAKAGDSAETLFQPDPLLWPIWPAAPCSMSPQTRTVPSIARVHAPGMSLPLAHLSAIFIFLGVPVMPRVYPGSSRVRNEPQTPRIGFWFDGPLEVPLCSREPDSEPLQTVYKKGRARVSPPDPIRPLLHPIGGSSCGGPDPSTPELLKSGCHWIPVYPG